MVRFNGQHDLEQDFHAFMLRVISLCYVTGRVEYLKSEQTCPYGLAFTLKPRINKLANRNPRTKKLGMLFSSSPLSKELNYVLYIS